MPRKKPSTTKRASTKRTNDLRDRLDAEHGSRNAADPIVQTVKDDPASAGRPRTVVDERVLAGLAAIQCTYNEMAAVLSVDESTLRLHYKDLIEKERDAGKMGLRRAQMQSAYKGNATMLIWLGKQYLGQKDKHELGDGNGNLIPMLVVRREDVDTPLAEAMESALDGHASAVLDVIPLNPAMTDILAR